MQTLLINAHPGFSNPEGYSAKMQRMFLDLFKEQFKNKQPTILNLYDTHIPRIENGQLLTVWEKQQAGMTLTDDEKTIAATSEALLKQFKAHHRIVIVSPLHNFNITSRMKDYMDNILIARETFKYTEDGSIGLMTDDYHVLLLQASGSVYTNDDRYTPLEFSHYYLKEMFQEIMGFNKFYIVRAQGTDILQRDDILVTAHKEMTKVFDLFYSLNG
ncbi:FMN-dependent NADH-azoreductase [Bacillaceae bacterium SIJ1]|uniref:FMN-dependent NADH-azoreductase n=1 Tax=Litoribacterium kuwaitense TaxID=1398745 RepID=UPI0013EB2DDD|nr:NAD(P)H-dependent oxidoreductase [Litoribacterium kuwaitense]NGP46326.1 FMN-dependent NADH-azoreductase [Litoribacterium kuwaitense]